MGRKWSAQRAGPINGGIVATPCLSWGVFSLAEGKNDPPFTPGEGTPGGVHEITSSRLCPRKQDKLL